MKNWLVNLVVYIEVIELSVDGFKALAGSDPTQTFAPLVITSLGSLVRNRFENARQTTKTAALSAHRCLEYKVDEAKRKQLSRVSLRIYNSTNVNKPTICCEEEATTAIALKSQGCSVCWLWNNWEVWGLFLSSIYIWRGKRFSQAWNRSFFSRSNSFLAIRRDRLRICVVYTLNV